MQSDAVAQKAADDMRALCLAYEGDQLHQAADKMMCDLMRQAGYGDAVDVFLAAIGDYHAKEGPP